MSTTSSLDTNTVIRYLTNDIPEQRELVKKLLATKNATFYLSDLALSEAIYVLTMIYRKPRTEIVNLLNLFFAHYDRTVIYNRALTSAVFPFYLAHPKLSFNDCCLAYYAEAEHHEPLFTFDKALARQASSAKLVG